MGSTLKNLTVKGMSKDRYFTYKLEGRDFCKRVQNIIYVTSVKKVKKIPQTLSLTNLFWMLQKNIFFLLAFMIFLNDDFDDDLLQDVL